MTPIRTLLIVILATLVACSATSPARLCTSPLVSINAPDNTHAAASRHSPAAQAQR